MKKPKQKYDNEAVSRAKAKVTDLVKRGYRLSSDASNYYHDQVIQHSKSPTEKYDTVIQKNDPVRVMKRKKKNKKGK